MRSVFSKPIIASAIAVLSTLAIVYFIIVVALFLTSCKFENKKEIASWNFGQGADKVCPPFGSYPLFLITNQLPSKLKGALTKEENPRMVVLKAAARWNEVSLKHSNKLFFEKAEDSHLYNNSNPIFVSIEPAPLEEYSFGKTCELHLKGVDSFIASKGLAWTQFSLKGGKAIGGRTQLCTDKYAKLISMMGDKIAEKTRQGGLYRIFLHELGHSLGGIGTAHPAFYGEVMRSVPENEAISHHFESLLLERVIKPCLQANRWTSRK